jgi:hypothetical protein
MDCRVEAKLCAELVDGGRIMKLSLCLNKESCFDWSIPLGKFQTEKVLTIQEIL